MPALAARLRGFATREIDAPVTDLTGLKGFFDFQLSWTQTADGGDPGTTIFEALQDQLGLKLEPLKLLIDAIVVDHVERVPIEN